jgi:hypothetical protein
MSKIPAAVLVAILMAHCMCPSAFAFGEDVLAHTGEFTFFIKPDPGSCKTYTQKMVPCVEKKTVPVVKLINKTYPVPVPKGVIKPTKICENPMAEKGKPQCVQCFPKSRVQGSSKKLVRPQMIPVTTPGMVIAPKCVTKKTMKPVWFEFKESPAPPRMRPRKVKYPRKVGPRG